jgi:hypothetical protein
LEELEKETVYESTVFYPLNPIKPHSHVGTHLSRNIFFFFFFLSPSILLAGKREEEERRASGLRWH